MRQRYWNRMAWHGPVFILVLITCSVAYGQEVRSNYLPDTNFLKYHTYKWVMIQSDGQPNQIIDEEIKRSIDSQLATKAFIKVDTDKADLYVGYQTAVDQEREWNAWGTGRGFGGSMGSATSSTINVGTLILDIYDPAAKKLVWTGRATKALNPSSDPEKNRKNLDKAVAKLLKNFPPARK
jgi:hypothetical protein